MSKAHDRASRKNSRSWPAIIGGAGSPKSRRSFAKSIPIRWSQLAHNPVALLEEHHTRPARTALPRRGPALPHQRRVSPLGRVHGVVGDVGLDALRDSRPAAGRLLLGRVRHPRVAADLFRRPGRAGRGPPEKCGRPGHSARRRRPVVRRGLFLAAHRRERLAAGVVHRDRDGRTADPAGPRSRRQAGRRLGHHAERQDLRPRLAGQRGPRSAVSARHRHSAEQRRRPPSDGPPLRRRPADAHPPGDHPRHRRGPRPQGPGHPAERDPHERRALGLRAAGIHPRADEGGRPEFRRGAPRDGLDGGLHDAHAGPRRTRPLRSAHGRRARRSAWPTSWGCRTMRSSVWAASTRRIRTSRSA